MAPENFEAESSITDQVAEEKGLAPVKTPASSYDDDYEARGTWRHAAFHVATTIATPAAYAPLPFAVASLGWPLGKFYIYIY